MVDCNSHDDVESLRLTWWRSRLVGYAVHAYVVRGVLIDSGFPAVANEILDFVRERRIRGAIVTHAHEDHAGNAERFAASGLPLWMDTRTRHAVETGGRIGSYRHFTWAAMPRLRSAVIPFSDPSLEAVHTPGHSEDHHAVWDHDTATLFAGDLYLGVKVRVAHPHEDPRTLVTSLRAMVARRPRRVFCAHRGFVSGGSGALEAKADWTEATICEIERLARSGAAEREIRARTLGPRGWTHWFSAGDYSPDNFVRAVLRVPERSINDPLPRVPHAPHVPHAHR
ncbi:MAG TPA: MBL fold metallo-hydrolase [Gemmatimonas sp.]|nr:MBL fold metallo-hydrolase [Gemmatimonas sp.]